MQLYFSPLACSMATRIALYEAGAEATYTEVDPKTKRTADGDDLRAINPMGQVPTLRTDDGEVLTENAAILQYVADRYPRAKLAPPHRARLHQWLSFVGTELHKALFAPFFSSTAPAEAKAYALDKGETALGVVANHLRDRAFLLDDFSVADCYLVTVLGWAPATPVDLREHPPLAAYVSRLRERPAVAKAFAEEFALYKLRS